MPIELVLEKKSRKRAPLEPSLLAHHTAVLAQSGSGKSFMLGRLIEEIAVHSKARTVVLDPNSDFIRLREIDEETWSSKALSKWLYPGDTRAKFAKVWGKLGIEILSNRNLSGAKRLVIDWGTLSEGEMAAILSVNPVRDADLFWFLALANQIASETWDASEEPSYDFDHFVDTTEKISQFMLDGSGPKEIRGNPLAKNLRRAFGATLAFKFRSIVNAVGEYDIWRSKGDEEQDVRQFLTESGTKTRVVVIDLLSLATDDEKTIIVSRVLNSLWDSASSQLWESIRDFNKKDLRVPTFLVIDEAHNLVPAESDSPSKERVASLVMRVAAEGRKFGIHVIVASQRPRKIHASVLSECDNLVLMRMTNRSDVAYAQGVFGFLPRDFSVNASSLSRGDVLLCGSLGSGDRVFHTSPRRTVPSGKDIPSDFWTRP